MALAPGSPKICAAVAVKIIISYDGTHHDDDALMLGRMLAAAGAELSLAYVRHAREYDPRREEIAAHDAERRLAEGAAWLGDASLSQLVTINPSTSAGLGELAAAEEADLVLFASDYRTPPGHVEPLAAAQGLLEGGPVAIGVAAAGLRTSAHGAIRTVTVAGGDGQGAAARTAETLAGRTGAERVPDGGDADLILVDSRPDVEAGRIALDGATRGRLDSARASVIVLRRDVPLDF